MSFRSSWTTVCNHPDIVKAEIDSLQETICIQRKEIERLKSGDFTKEEFQNICHNKDVQDGYECFIKGCNEYQKKLFGKCQNEDVEKHIEAVKSIERISKLNKQFDLLLELRPS